MNSVLLSKNKYTAIGFGQTDKHSEKQYRLFINRVKLKQKNYTNVLVMFVNLYNTFITEKYSDEKDLWLIVNNNQTTNYDLLDSKGKIYDYTSIIKELENRIMNLEKNLRPVIGHSLHSCLYKFLPSNLFTSDYVNFTFKNSYNYIKSMFVVWSCGNLNWNLIGSNNEPNYLVYLNQQNVQFNIQFSSMITQQRDVEWKFFNYGYVTSPYPRKDGRSTLTIDLISI